MRTVLYDNDGRPIGPEGILVSELAEYWIQGVVKCRVCSHRSVAVAPYPVPGLCDLECSNCGCLACDELDEDEYLTEATSGDSDRA